MTLSTVRSRWSPASDGDEDFDQRWGEGVELAELAAVALTGDDGIDHGIAQLADAGELSLDNLARGFVPGLEQAPARDGSEVAIFQSDSGKALLPMFESHFHL